MARRKLYHAAAAAYLGIAASTWRDYHADGRTPPPDGTDTDRGHARPWWHPETLDAWQAARPGPGARTDLNPRGPAMTTTTEYGTWCNATGNSLSVEQSVADAFGSEGTDGFDVDAIVSEYRAAVNDALPEGVSLNGDDFYGPAYAADQHFDGYPVSEYGGLDIKAIVESIDLWAIIERHAVEPDHR